MKQIDIVRKFCEGANYFMVVFNTKNDEEFGKIIEDKDINNLELDKHEVYRSIEYRDGDTLFVLDLKPKEYSEKVNNPLQLLLENLDEARTIEMVYPEIFKWAFDGVSLKAYGIVPSGDFYSQSTITRYGGVEMFIRILRQHLRNIGKMKKGTSPDYNFVKNNDIVDSKELSIGSLNNFNKMFSVMINLNMDYKKIIKNSGKNINMWRNLNKLNMKYWSREINPDFINEAKHIKLTDTLNIDMEFKLYPPCIKNLMKLKNKGNYNRYLLSRFLLSIHSQKDAKFIYYSVLGDEERKHIKNGNCSTQWNYIMNNKKRYDCPTCIKLKRFCVNTCKLSHPLEKIQKKINENNKEKK